MSEPLARELGLAGMPRDADRWILLLAEHPQLIQRPLVLGDDGRAWVARDDETLTEVVAAGRRHVDGPRTAGTVRPGRATEQAHVHPFQRFRRPRRALTATGGRPRA
jgi:hypothetical protein